MLSHLSKALPAGTGRQQDLDYSGASNPPNPEVSPLQCGPTYLTVISRWTMERSSAQHKGTGRTPCQSPQQPRWLPTLLPSAHFTDLLPQAPRQGFLRRERS